MQEAQGFLKRFQKILQQKEDDLELIIETIKEIADIDLTKDQIKIRNKVLRTSISGGEKGRLFLKKQEIIDSINKKKGKYIISNLY